MSGHSFRAASPVANLMRRIRGEAGYGDGPFEFVVFTCSA